MIKRKLSPPAIVEIVFDFCYLCFAAAAGVYFIVCAWGDAGDIGHSAMPLALYGSMALTLAFGDAFHLLPRMYSLWTDTMREHARALGFGKQVTSVTMTFFYVMLFYAWQMIYGMRVAAVFYAAVWGLAAVRIVLCLYPMRQWYEPEHSQRAAILRNVPFVLLGAVIAWLYAVRPLPGFAYMPFAIFLSFAFYLLVVLFAGKKPAMGAFMLPKTGVYVWIICMGFSMLGGGNSPKFNGSRTGNDSQLIMDFSILNKTDSQILKLEKGDIVDAEIVNEAGKLSILVQMDGEEPLFAGEPSKENKEWKFQLTIPESGDYTFSVTGTKARGSVSFIKETEETDSK